MLRRIWRRNAEARDILNRQSFMTVEGGQEEKL
jgi:hypothetical protein